MKLLNLITFAVGALALHANAAETSVGPEYRVGGFVLGCQAYTFHRFTAFEAIEFYPGQSLSPEDKMYEAL